MITTDHAEKNSTYYDDIYAQGYNTSVYDQLYECILGTLKKMPDATPRVLEIGCGVGDLGRMIVRAGISYRGFDFSEQAISCSKQVCPEGKFWVGDAYESRNYQPRDYNVAIALEVLEHLDDIRIIKNLPAGVHLFASVPDYDDIAHLRIYTDPQRDIVERFRPYLEVVQTIPLSFVHNATGSKMTIFIFHGVRKHDVEVTNQLTNRLNESSSTGEKKVSRNAPCPCGSGQKFKKCCG